MIRITKIFFLLILGAFTSMAQVNHIDSLETLLSKSPKPEDKIEIFSDLMRELIRVSPARAFETGKKLKALADSMDSDLGRAHYYRSMASLSYIQGNYLYSTSFVFRAIELYSTLKDSIGIANSYVTLANSYSRQGLYQQAVSYQKRALKVFKFNKNYRRLGVSLTNLCYLYNKLGKYDSALILNNQSIQINEQIGSGSVLINDYKNQGYSYYYLADYPRAIQSFLKSFAINEQIGGEANVESMIEALLGISMTYEAIGKTEAAITNSKRAVWLASNYGYLISLEGAFLQVSSQYKRIGDFKEAHHYLENYANVVDSLRQVQRTELEALGDVYLNALRESTQNQSLLKEKELSAKLISQQRNSLFIGAGFILLLGVLVFYLKKSNIRRRQINETLNQQKEEIATKNKELEKLNLTKDKFFSIVAHDLKSPLNSLKSFMSILHSHADHLTKDEIVNTGKQLDETLENTIKMADNLIVWAKQQMHTEEGVPENLPLAKLVSTVYDVYKEVADQKSISFTWNVPETISAYGDKNQILFIIRNLVNNAIKFTQPGGQITIIATPQNHNKVRIEVSDTGIGISELALKKIFEISATVKTRGTAGEKGTGLGLALCKEFVELNNGEIWAQSTEGSGTTFFVELPKKIM